MSHSRVVAAVEIGTSKVAVFLGELVEGTGLNIIGHCACASRGVRKGQIINLAAASECVYGALSTAEKNAHTQVDEVYLAQTGSHLEGVFNIGMTNVSASDSVVRETDIEQAKGDARRRTLPPDRTYIHHIQNPFILDGRAVESPLALGGNRLEVGYWSVHGDRSIVSDCIRVIHGMDLEMGDMIIASIASGSVLLEESEKNNGALVIDIGAGTTDFGLYRKGYIVRTGVVPVGGDHITNDLSIGLRIGRKSAEKFKLEFGRAVYKTEDRDEPVWLIGDLSIGDRQYPLGAITKIIEVRLTEVFEIIKGNLQEAGVFIPADIASGVVLTGGTARLPGLTELAEKTFGLSARVAEGPADVIDELRRPEYSTALGLLYYAMTGQEAGKHPPKRSGILRRLTQFLNFD